MKMAMDIGLTMLLGAAGTFVVCQFVPGAAKYVTGQSKLIASIP